MSGIKRDTIRSSLAAFRISHHLAKDISFDNLIVESLYTLTNPTRSTPNKDKIVDILQTYFRDAPKKIAGHVTTSQPAAHSNEMTTTDDNDAEVDEQEFNRFFRRIFKRLLLKNGQFKSEHSLTLLGTMSDYDLHFIMPDEFSPLDNDTSEAESDTEALLPIDDNSKELKTLHHQTTFNEIREALAEELYYNDIKVDGYYIGYRHKKKNDNTLENDTPYQAYNTHSRLADISEDKVISPSPTPPKVNPVNVLFNINSGVDNALSTAADRVVKTFIAFAKQAGSTLEYGAILHSVFTWIGFGVSFIYTLGFAAGYLYRKFYLNEDVVFGIRDAVRMILSITFLAFCIASTFAAGPAALFIMGFPIIAAIGGLFTLGEQLYDRFIKNKLTLKELPDKKHEIKLKIKNSKTHLATLDLALKTEIAKDIPDINIIKNLLTNLADTHNKYVIEKNSLIKLLETERATKEQQIRLQDPLTIFISCLRTFNVLFTIVGAGLFFVNPIVGLSIVAFCGVLGLIVFGLAVYNKHRLDKKIEGTLDAKPAVGELSESIFNPHQAPKRDKSHALIADVLLKSNPSPARVRSKFSIIDANENNVGSSVETSPSPSIKPIESHVELRNLAGTSSVHL